MKKPNTTLKGDDIGVGEMAHLVGYENVSYSCEVFRRLEGVSTGKFRKMYKG